MQLSMCVSLVLMTVMSMQLALIEMEALTVSVLLATVAMEHTVMVNTFLPLSQLELLLLSNVIQVYFYCLCTTTYVESIYFLYLLDVNECDIDIDSCHMNATCINTVGSYDCKCDRGFSGDGLNCSSKFLDLDPP